MQVTSGVEYEPTPVHLMMASVQEMAAKRYAVDEDRVRVVFGLAVMEKPGSDGQAGPRERIGAGLSYHKSATVAFGLSTDDPVVPRLLAAGLHTAWRAELTYGPGKWSNIQGDGATPELALTDLHVQMLESHILDDERRQDALRRARLLHPRRECCNSAPGEDHQHDCRNAPVGVSGTGTEGCEPARRQPPPRKQYENRPCCVARINEPHVVGDCIAESVARYATTPPEDRDAWQRNMADGDMVPTRLCCNSDPRGDHRAECRTGGNEALNPGVHLVARDKAA